MSPQKLPFLAGFVPPCRIGLAAAILLGGCTQSPAPFHPHLVARQDEAGSAEVAVLSVNRWESVRDAVQPTFTLTADDALNQSIPTALNLEDKVLSAFGLTGKAGLAFPSTAPVDLTKFAFAASPVGSQTASGLPPASSVLGNPTGIDPMLRYWAATALYQEVQLLNRYVNSAALTDGYTPYLVRLQVSLQPRSADEPYDAYTDISMFNGPWTTASTPLQNVGVVGGVPSIESNTLKQLFASESARALGLTQAEGQAVDRFIHQKGDTGVVSAPQVDLSGTPKIVPLLVTDDIEAALRSGSAEQIRQIALGLSAAFHGVGVSGDIQNVDQQLRTVLGHDLNSTFTVARVSDNTIRARFGAQYSASSHYAVVPQTHTVTLLMLVKKDLVAPVAAPDDKSPPNPDSRKFRVLCRTTFVRSDTGDVPPARDYDEYESAVKEQLAALRIGIAEEQAATGAGNGMPRIDFLISKKVLDEIIADVVTGRYEHFKRVVDTGIRLKSAQSSGERKTENPAKGPPADGAKSVIAKWSYPYSETLWLALTTIQTGSRYASATITVPPAANPRLLLVAQQPLVSDDGKTGMTVVVRGIDDVAASDVVATLSVVAALPLKKPQQDQPNPQQQNPQPPNAQQPIPAEPSPEPTTFTSTKVVLSPSGGELTFTFPSLKALGRGLYVIPGKPPTPPRLLIYQTRRWPYTDSGNTTFGLLPPFSDPAKDALSCVYIQKAAPALHVYARAHFVNADAKGKGDLDLNFEDIPDNAKITLSVDGADIDSDPTPSVPNMITHDKKTGKLQVTKTGVLTLHLTNLHPMAPLTFSAADETSGASVDTFVVQVDRLQSAKPASSGPNPGG